MSTTPPVALVTGASSGFGYLIARELAAHGFRVFGTSRSGAAGPDGVAMLALDVDRDAAVTTCVAQLLRDTGRIDVLVNNAGRAMVGAAEESTAAEARALFETNLFGMMRVTSAVLPAMRTRRAGRIINLGSVSGFVGLPFHGIYAATKHAVAGYSEALRHEVQPFGIAVVVVEPAAHRTAIQMSQPARPLADYDHGRGAVERYIRGLIDRGPDPRNVARVVAAAAMARAPRLRYRVGAQARLAGWARRLLPDWLFEAYLRRELRLPAAAPAPLPPS